MVIDFAMIDERIDADDNGFGDVTAAYESEAETQARFEFGGVALTVFCVPLALPVLCGSSGNRSSRLHRQCDWVR